MNNQIQLVLKSSTAEMPLNDHELGIYLVPELDGLVGLPEIRTTSGVNAGYDGGWTSAQNYDARSITIRGVIANQDVATVERLRKQLVSLAGQGKKEELTLDLVTEAGNAYTLQVRTIALDMAMKSVLEKQEFMLQLRADDPLIYDASESAHEAFIQVSKATGGFLIDFELPLAITGGSDEASVENNGFEQVPTVTKMYGALHNPKLVNQTTNQFMQIEADLGFSEGQWVDPSEPVEGKSITINGAPADAPFADIQLKGDTSQASTPTPSAPVAVQTVTGENVVKICGKNLVDINNFKSGTYSSITGEYSGYGSRACTIDKIQVKPSSTYAVDNHCTNGYTIRNLVDAYKSDGTFISRLLNNGSNGATFTTTADTAFINLTLSEASDTMRWGDYQTDFANGTIQPQIELGSPATDFEPYIGQSYEVNLGKNLLDISTFAVGGMVNGTAQPDTKYRINNAANPIKVEPNTTYSISCVLGDTVKGFRVGVHSLSGSKTFISDSQWQRVTSSAYTFTTGATTEYIALVCSLSTTSTTVTTGSTENTTVCATVDDFMRGAKLQAELGNATGYADYFTPIELCKIGTYQDSIYKDGGKWYLHKVINKYTTTGSENWTEYQAGFYYATDVFATPVTERVACYCDTLKGFAASDNIGTFISETSGTSYAANTHTAQGLLRIKNADMTSLAGFKTWLAANPATVYFPLATPTDTEITDDVLVAQLEELLNNASMYNPQTNISSQFAVGNAQGELGVSYYTSKTPDIRDELIIDSRLRTITLNGVDVYHLKTAGSEFIMLAPGENRLSLESDIPGDNGYAQVSYKQGYLSI